MASGKPRSAWLFVCSALWFGLVSQTVQAADELVVTKSLVTVPTANDPSGDNPVDYQPGDILNYDISATNNGAVAVTVNAVNEALVGAVVTGCTPALPAVLQPGESISCAANYTVSQNDEDTGHFVLNEASFDYIADGDSATQSAIGSETVIVSDVPNQDLPLQCGIDIVLVMDSSGSIGNESAIDDVVLAARGFADAFSNTGTRMAIASYSWGEDGNGAVPLPFTDLTPSTVGAGGAVDVGIGSGVCDGNETGYTDFACAGGATNWEAGLLGGLRELQGARAGVPQLVVHLTDGSPNTYIDPDNHSVADPNPDPQSAGLTCSNYAVCPSDVSIGRLRAVPDAIAAANQIKATGAHIYSIGVGKAFAQQNCDGTGCTTAAQSEQLFVDSTGPDIFRYDPADPANSDALSDFKANASQLDVILVRDFADLQPVLRELASSLCAPSLTITKFNVPADPAQSEQPAEGIDFLVSPNAAPADYDWVLPSATPPSDNVFATDASGLVQTQWAIEPPVGWEAAGGTVDVDEVNFDPSTTDFEIECSRTDQDGTETIDLSGTLDPAAGSFSVDIGSSDIVTCEIRNREKASASIDLDKSVADDNGGEVVEGDTLTYTFVLTNDGNVPLSNVTLSDPLPGLGAFTCERADASAFNNGTDGLAIGESVSCTAPYTVTAADAANGKVENTATVTGTPPTGDPVDDMDDEVIETAGNPAIETTKEFRNLDTDADGSGDVSVGDVISYRIVVTNTGNVTLNNVVVNDPLTGTVDMQCGLGTIAPGQACGVIVFYTVQPNDADVGNIHNVAVGSGESPSGEEVEDDDDEDVPVAQNPAIGIVKSLSSNSDEDGSGDVSLGDTLNYEIVTTNTGNVTLNNVVVSDSLIATLSCTPSTPATLSPAASITCTGSYSVTQADVEAGEVVNVATADSDETDPVTDNHEEDIPQNPGIGIVKSLASNSDEDGSGDVSLGDTLNYEIVTTNTGNMTLNNVTVTDSLIATLSCTPSTPAILLPGDAITCLGSYSVTQAEVNAGEVVNVATADSDETDPETDTHEEEIPQNPKHKIVKSTLDDKFDDADGSGTVSLGDRIRYKIVLTNNGNITLTGATISDSLIPTADLECKTLADGVVHAADAGVTLQPGDKFRCYAWYTVTQANVDAGSILNVATGDTDQTDPKDDDVEIPVDQNPGLGVVKSMTGNNDEDGSGTNSLGDTLNYEIVATNSGNVTLTNVTVTDSLIATLSCNPATPATLAPGASVTCTGTYQISQGDVDNGEVLNTATGDSDQTDPETDNHEEEIPQNPGLGIDKELSGNADEDNSRGITIGDTLEYTITASNTGDTTLNNVVVSDPMLDNTLTCTPANGSSLSVGAQMVCIGTYVVQQSDVDAEVIINTATADTDETDPEEDTETTPVPHNPNIGIIKKMTKHIDKDLDGNVTVNDKLKYQITATNTGDMTLTGVVINDPLFDSVDPATGLVISALVCKTLTDDVAHAHDAGVTLLPGEKFRCVATYKVTAADIAAGSVLNVATADSDQTPEEDDEVDTPTYGIPGLTIDKEVTDNDDPDRSRNATVGDTLTYTITATNSGQVNLTGVSISDPMLASTLTCNPGQNATLAPGDTLVCTGTHLITDADATAGEIVNTATADSDQTDPVDDSVTVGISSLANMAITKEMIKHIDLDGSNDVTTGDKLKYRITIKNVGTSDLTNVTFTDSLIDQADFTCNKPAAGTQPPVPVTLVANEAMKCVATYKILASDITQDALGRNMIKNVAVADSDQTDPEDDSTETWITANAGISVDKFLKKLVDNDGDGVPSIGDKLRYAIDTTNTGDIVLTGVTVTDTLVAQSDLSCTAPDGTQSDATGTFTLQAGETVRCIGVVKVEVADVALGQIVNVATADSNETDPVEDTETVTVPQNPAIAIDKEMSGYDDIDGTNNVSPGDVLNYTITVTNSGPVIVNNVTVADPLLPAMTCTPAQGATLLPNEQMICTGQYTVTQADQDNEMVSNTAVADSDETDPVDDTQNTAVSRVIDLTVKKLMTNHNDKDNSGGISNKDKLKYRIDATNNGNVILTNVTIVDSLIAAADLSCTHTDGTNPVANAGVTLVPGERLRCIGVYKVTAQDQVNGAIINTATGESDQTAPEIDIIEVQTEAP